jgi:D-alanyl-D-alanine carboxypeptidase (penicillin-binding protein 5/6)
VAAGGYAGWKLLRPPPRPAVRLGLPATLVLDPGAPPPIPTPALGSFDLVSADGVSLASRNPDAQVPIASIAKVMAALVALQKLPLSPGEAGPTYTIIPADVADYRRVAAEGGSRLFVSVGERFTEQQMLLGLLLPSADNLADTLGTWAEGSDAAFVQAMNAEAQALGMTATHFADASGLSQQTVSTASDLVKLGEAALANPALAAAVATTSATMPDRTVVRNLDSNLGSVPGWLGIKTGSTSQAGGCLLFAAQDPGPAGLAGPVRVVGAILGQPLTTGVDGLGPALGGSAAAVKAAFAGYDTLDPASMAPPDIPGRVTAAWGTASGLQAAFQSGHAPFLVRKGSTATLAAHNLASLPADVHFGTAVARVTARSGGTTVATWSVTATGDLGTPTWQWLLTH